jgi:serine/threonine-protein kinase
VECVSEQQVLDFVAGRLEASAFGRMEQHIDSCVMCMAAVGQVARASVADGSPGEGSKGAAPRRVGRYEIVEQIGEGGMGVVYLADDPQLGRRVALKLVRPDLAPQGSGALRPRIEREARAMARLSHPNVVAVYDVGVHEDQVFIVMELVEGGTLRQWLAREPRDWREVLEVLLEAARGLSAAHAAGVVHRDLKPDNVLVGKDARVRVTDFGLARANLRDQDAWSNAPANPAGPTISRTGTLLGSPAYMAPEQMRGDDADRRADVFSFCVTLWEALYGERPFPGETLGDIEASIGAGRLREVGRGSRVPRWLHEALLRGLRADPAERPHSVDALVALLTPPRSRRLVALVALLLAATALSLPFFVAQKRANPAATPTIAVLPFVDLSTARDQEQFADGLAEELISALARVDGLRVVGRTSSFSFKGKKEDLSSIGRKLGSAAILEGSVQKAGARARIAVQLVNAPDGYHLWSEVYDEEVTDIFAVQDRIARSVVAALAPKLLPTRPAPIPQRKIDPEAYAQYLLGGHHRKHGYTGDAFRKSVAAFRRAVEIDPAYGAAWAGLAVAESLDADTASTLEAMRDGRDRAEAAAEKAVALAPDLAEAYAARSLLRFFKFDSAGARADAERALSLAPSDADILSRYGRGILASAGRLPEAIAAVRSATLLDPLSGTAWEGLGHLYLGTGQTPLAREALERALELDPGHSYAAANLVTTLLLEGQPAAALEVAQHMPPSQDVLRLMSIAMVQSDLHHPVESQKALDELAMRFAIAAAYQVAGVHAWRGESDLAFQWLDRAVSQRDGGLMDLKWDPLFRGLRGDPRYAALLRKMNLPPDR